MQKIIVGLCTYTIIASGIAFASGGADDPACPPGGQWYMNECEPTTTLAACLLCCRRYPQNCDNRDAMVADCESLCRRFNTGV